MVTPFPFSFLFMKVSAATISAVLVSMWGISGPVSADLEYGLGHSTGEAAETIRQVAQTGVAGCSLEDHTGDPNDPIFETSLAVERVAAAVEASNKVEGGFVLTARCENLLWNKPNLDEVVERLAAYEAVGADVLYAPALKDLGDIKKVCAALNNPVNVVMEAGGNLYTAEQLSAAGVKRISVGGAPAQLAYGSLVTAAKEMIQDGTFDFAQEAMDFDKLNAFFRQSP